MTAGERTERAPAIVERLVKQLNIAFKAVKLYPLTSDIPRQTAREALTALREIARSEPEVRFEVTKDGLLYNGKPVYGGHAAFTTFALEFYNRGLTEVRFHAGVTADEVIRFLSVLDIPPVELAGSGGVEGRLWELQVTNISVQETKTRIVDSVATPEEEEAWPPEPEVVDEVLLQSFGRRPRGQRLLVRLMNDVPALADFVQSPAEGSPNANAITIAKRFSALARTARAEAPAERAELFKRLVVSMGEIDPGVLREALGELVDEARTAEPVGELLRTAGLEKLTRQLIAELTMDASNRDEIVRTVRNLVAFGIGSRAEVAQAAGQALAEAGASAEYTGSVISGALPTRLQVRERARDAKPADVVLQLLDIAANNAVSSAQALPEYAELQQEVASGITDAEVLGALASVLAMEDRFESFDGMADLLQDNLVLLVGQGDLEIAADAAEALLGAADRTDLTDEQRARLRAIVDTLSGVDPMRNVASVMRVSPHDSPEYEQARRLLAVLGEHPVASLLEVLADESDMTARKALVDQLSVMAPDHIRVFGERVTDSRWYFVRNIVSILGATRSAEVLPYLARTLRHTDARVRRETIRGLSGIRTALSDEMLVAALDDEDAANVQLAARHLGTLHVRAALPALEAVARGDGRGNRDQQTRIEAIEALGRIGDPAATKVLRDVSRQRGLLASKTRELRAAAERALQVLGRGGRDA